MKSKFLQNSKDMLSRSFNPIKCKTSLRLAGSRLKLLRNKKEVQLKQMKREIAQLLESGQDQTARIRVEHVIREEKMMAAYDLLEIYCELIIARLPIIESQKDCPIDLKEAIASIVFSSPRCGDVPELLDVRKHFSAKYGKEFITAATELRPMCGVGRLLVEKLSAAAPDGPTKTKILNAIADEHNVKWDHKSFDEKDLGRLIPIGKESELHSESPRFEAADVQVRPSYDMHGLQLNLARPDAKISLGEENLSSGQASGVTTKTQPESRPPGVCSSPVPPSPPTLKSSNPGEKMSQLLQGDGYNSQLDSQKWNMEFKDAASAAQAAAEAAERAGMAARAAAELSSHGWILTQYSSEPQKSDGYNLKAEGVEGPPNLNSFEKKSEASANTSSSVHTGLESAEVDECEPDPMSSSRLEESGGGSEEYSRSASLKFKASGGDDLLYHSSPFADDYIQKNSLKEEESEGEMNMKKQSSIYETETSNGWQKKAENLGEGKIVKQKSLSISDDVNIFADFDYDADEDPFTNISNVGFHVEAPQTSSHETDALFFDKSDSEVDDEGPTYDEQDLEFHLGQKSQSINSWSPRSSSSNVVKSASPPLFFARENSPPDVSENTTLRVDAELDNVAAVTFDDSRGSSDEDMNVRYETGDESVRSEFQDKTGHESVGSPPKMERTSEIDSKLSLSSDDDRIPWKRNQFNIFDADSSENQQPSLESEDSQMESKDIGNESRLDFGKLTGGFRHKGHNHLPIFKNNRSEAETAPTITSSTTLSSVEHPKIVTMPHHMKSSHLDSESDSDTCEEEEILLESSPKIKLNLGASNSNFYSDDSDLDEDFPKVSNTRKSHLQCELSRRTKASPSSSRTNSMSLRSEAAGSNGMDTKATTSYISETSETNRRSSENNDQPISVKTNSGKASYNTMQEPKISNKSSAPFASEKPETATLNKITSNKDENPKKTSHVHPKLPDYDALVQSLRKNSTS
ncbi:hypothetical protein ACS0TY_034606 [Phlomoides rotata]